MTHTRRDTGHRRPGTGGDGAHRRALRSCSLASREELSDEEIFELTYISAMYLQHAVVTRALRLEWDDTPEHVEEVDPPEEFDAEHYVAVGSTREAKEQLRNARR